MCSGLPCSAMEWLLFIQSNHHHHSHIMLGCSFHLPLSLLLSAVLVKWRFVSCFLRVSSPLPVSLKCLPRRSRSQNGGLRNEFAAPSDCALGSGWAVGVVGIEKHSSWRELYLSKKDFAVCLQSWTRGQWQFRLAGNRASGCYFGDLQGLRRLINQHNQWSRQYP